MSEEERYREDVRDHISKVRTNLHLFQEELCLRGKVHDSSKFSEDELTTFVQVSPKLRGTTYGTDEYKGLLGELGGALKLHYERNDHHPEHFIGGINDMNLFQIVEMFCDWLAAVEKHDDGDIYRSLDINRERFNMSDQLFHILKNTAVAMKK